MAAELATAEAVEQIEAMPASGAAPEVAAAESSPVPETETAPPAEPELEEPSPPQWVPQDAANPERSVPASGHLDPPEPAQPQPAPSEALREEPPPEAEDLVDLNTASFEQLRAVKLSVTQATRVLAHRERHGGYSSVDDLDDVPGFPQEVLDDLKRRVTV
jgi:DNA uptake protein ComE-like DNA-binding protein